MATDTGTIEKLRRDVAELRDGQERILRAIESNTDTLRKSDRANAGKFALILSDLSDPSPQQVLILMAAVGIITLGAVATNRAIKAYQALVQAIPGQQWGEGEQQQKGSQVASWEQLFEGGSNSLMAIAIGNAEGTRTPDGGKTSAFSSHTDPGNGVTNLGTFSYQHGASSPEEADQKQLERLKGQMQPLAGQLSRKDVATWLNLADLLNQSPAAGQNFPKYLQQCNGDILCARVKSYEGDAPGITRNGITIEQDQRRRMEGIEKAIAANQSKVVVNVGTGSTTGWINPAPGAQFTSGFGFRVHPMTQHTRCHYGIDLAAATGAPILAAKDGTVEIAGDENDGFGLKIVLKHPDGSKSLYAHLSKINVTQGQQVRQGNAIGLMGSTGNSTGPHLHWEVDLGNGTIDPLPLLPEKPPGGQTFGKIDSSKECMDKRL